MHGLEGIDHKGKLHSSNFFELVDEPITIQFALTESETERLFNRLNHEEISIFYVKTAIEFGTVGNKQGES